MIYEIKLEKIFPDPEQPRKTFNEKQMFELEQSVIKEGILTPLILESNYKGNNYLILDGERRYRIATELNFKKVPVKIIKGPLSFEERMIKRFHIQEVHQSWSIFDKARAIFNLKKMTNMNIIEIAEKLNTSAPRIHNWLSITDLTEESQKEVISKDISFSYLIHLIKVTKDYSNFLKLNQREIEEKLIKKIENNIFSTVLSFQRFSRLMSIDSYISEKTEFLNKTEMTLEDLFKNVELGKTIDLEIFYKNLDIFNKNITKIINKKYRLSKEFTDLLKDVKDKIDFLL